MTDPALVVEVELDPVGDPDVWTDMSGDTTTLSITRGKQLELDRFRTGKASLVIQNSDRFWDPAVTPDFKPNRRIRVTAQHGESVVLTPVTYTLYAGLSDGYAFAATPFAATAASTGDAGYIYAGQEVGGYYEGFLQFDTSAVAGTITSATLHLYGQADFGAGVDTWEVRAHDWGTTLGTTDWVSRANLPSLTLVASKAGAISTSSYNAFTSEAAFLAAINQAGSTRLLVNSLRHRTSVAPSGAEYARFESRDTGGTTTGPKLVIEALVEEEGDGAVYPLFTGYVDRARQDYTGPHTAQASVECSDAFKLFNRVELPTSAYAAEVEADGPAHWYRLNEPSDATRLYDSAGGRHLTVQGTIDQGASLVARDPDAALVVEGTASGGISAATPHAANVTAVTAELIFSTEATGAGQTAFAEIDGTASRGWVIQVDNGLVEAFVVTSAGSVALSAGDIDDGAPHHLALRWNGANAWLYIDGAQVDTDTLGGTMFAAGAQTYVIIGGATTGPIVNDGVAGTYDEAAVWYSDLGAARVADHHDMVATPWDGDTPAERIDRILDIVGFDPAARDLDTGTSTLQSATLGQTALEHIQKVADSDFGVVFMTADGTVRFRGRVGLANQESSATVTDAHGSSPAVSMLTPEVNDDLVRNDARVSRLDGKLQRARDDASIAEHGTITFTRDGLFHDSDTLSLNAAEWVVAEYAQPTQRINRVTIRPRGAPETLYPLVLGLELADVVLVEHTPQGTGDPISQLSVVEGIEHDIGPKHWETRLNVSPVAGGETGYWELGVAGHSELGETTRLFF